MKFQLLDSSSMKSYHFVCWNNMSNTPAMDEKKRIFHRLSIVIRIPFTCLRITTGYEMPMTN